MQKAIRAKPDRRSLTWLRNPTNFPRRVFIEPWGATLYLLPKHDYAVVTEAASDDPPAGATIELSDTITVWPEGTKSNRIYRADGKVTWDDADPSEVYQYLDDTVIATALDWVNARNYRPAPAELGDYLLTVLPDRYRSRDDLAYLLVEHGTLGMDEQGDLFAFTMESAQQPRGL
jgi:hypothetical protein